MDSGRETIEVSVVRDGMEIDLVTHDLKKFFGLLLKKNGYVLEQLYSPLVLRSSPEHNELKTIARNCLTRHHSHHSEPAFPGFASAPFKTAIVQIGSGKLVAKLFVRVLENATIRGLHGSEILG